MMNFEEEFDDKSESDEVSIQMTILKMIQSYFENSFPNFPNLERNFVLDKWSFFININR